LLATSLTVAYAHGGDPDRVLSLLATWLGHSAAGKLEPISESEIL